MLEYGASPVEHTQNGDDAMLYSVNAVEPAFTNSDRTEKSLILLFEYGANPNATNSTYSALQHAVSRNQLNCVRCLLHHGADPNFTGNDKMTPLMYAAMFANLSPVSLSQVMTTLLLHGAEMNLKSNVNRTALDYALLSKSTDALNILWPLASSEEQDSKAALYRAIISKKNCLFPSMKTLIGQWMNCFYSQMTI